MGQKVHPISMRLSDCSLENWLSRWCSKSNYRIFLHEDIKIREFLEGYVYFNGYYLGDIYIWRPSRFFEIIEKNYLNDGESYVINVQKEKPSIKIYSQIFIPARYHSHLLSWEQKSQLLYKIQRDIEHYINEYLDNKYYILLHIDPIMESFDLKTSEINLKAEEVRSNFNKFFSNASEMEFLGKWLMQKNAKMITQWISDEVSRRKGVRDIIRKLEKVYNLCEEFNKDKNEKENNFKNFSIKGMKISISGRFLLTDNEKRRNKMARIKVFKKGRVPLHTMKENIAYANNTSYTVDGTSGVKVWICYK